MRSSIKQIKQKNKIMVIEKRVQPSVLLLLLGKEDEMLYQNLRNLIHNRGWTIQTLAESDGVNVGVNTLSRALNQPNRMSLNLAYKLVRVLRIPDGLFTYYFPDGGRNE